MGRNERLVERGKKLFYFCLFIFYYYCYLTIFFIILFICLFMILFIYFLGYYPIGRDQRLVTLSKLFLEAGYLLGIFINSNPFSLCNKSKVL